ncbi:hypothetical protein [Paenibacillus terrigena]|nr:hypothetical protein [Paenibacillus terrigena]
MKRIIFFTFLIGLIAGCSHSKPPEGGVDTSYPAQAGAKKVEIIEKSR